MEEVPQQQQGRGATFGTSFELDVLAEINRARTNPRAYAAELGKLLSHFSDEKLFVDPDRFIKRNTQEGKLAVQEVVSSLHRMEPTHPLTMVVGLSRSCLELV